MKRYVYINDDELSPDLYCGNRISNRKYTLLNFLPKNLWEQFSRFMNQYFLLIACLQLWPLITPVNPASTWGPLIFIFAVSASKEAWDDYNRYLSDKKANEKEVWVVRQGIKKHIQAQDIHVGNIVWLRENEEAPCDLVLIGTSEPQGLCYIETAALDGETDLKTRVIPSACMGIDFELLHKIKGVIECPNPDKDIIRFDANLRLFPPFIDNDVCPLTIKNTILQSCYLRNTEWACGVAVYTGNETKLGMSRGIPEPKLTAIDAMIDKLTGAIFVFQIVVVIVLGIAGNVWKDTEARKQWYVRYPNEGPWYELLIIPLRFELLCSIMIPISIKVSLDLVKSLYAKFIDWDNEMLDVETATPSHAANTAISEDLGQVEYILTDKTGTLTENMMIFKRCCISGIFYGNESGDALKDVELFNAVASGSPDAIRFLTVMAICNTVVPMQSKSGAISYKAQSQDEEALVHAASHLHMVFVKKNMNILEIKFNASIVQYEVLDTLEFTSDRKRMSVVVKDLQNGKIMLLSKGADEAILPYACGQQTRTFAEAVEQYSQLGLRTLCLAWRELEEDEYQEWSLMFKEANSTLVDREWKVAEVCQKLEHDFKILGVAAIEDRLQDGVPETIETLRKAGINFWMLTGDKQNTAIQIALSCNFVSPEPKGQLLLINGKTEDEVCRSLERVLRTMRITNSEPKDVAFVVDGWALEIALKHYRKAFTELAILSRTAICCRVTPSQKAQLVELLKSCDYRTLAIGDGGNDVRMIQQADIGVGISGREGLQAARAADYGIGKFRFLKRLILVHGRYSYNRTAFLSQYSFYKSLLICFIQIFFSFISGVSGTSLFNSVSLMAYNVFYTSIPVLVSVLDKDLSERTVMQHPQILFYCQAGRLLNPSTFAGWFGRSLFHAIVVFIITVHAYAYEKSEMEQGNQLDNTLNPATYAAALAVLNEKFGLEMTKDHLKNWLKTWKKQYGVLQDILAQKGFKWDEAQKMVVADDAVWNDYIKSIKNYEELCIIFGNDQAIVTSDIDAEVDSDLVCDNEGMETAIVSVTQNDDKQAKNLRWTEEMDRCLGKVLVKEVQKGHKVDNVIQTEAYKTAVAALNEIFGPDITKDHIKNRLKTWKKQYLILKELLSHTGFKWDETQNKVIGDDSGWNDYIKTHHEAHLFQGRVVENYDHLCIIFGNNYATGSYSRTADDIAHTLACDSEGVEAINVSPIQCYDSFQYQAMNMRWTSEMDHCLSMILVEQVKLGNKRKSDNKFKPAAYAAAVSVLRERFQLDFTKDHVKTQIKAWKKLYSSVKELLDQSEFQWDEKLKMVIANDPVWDKYIKINPDVRLLQGQVIKNYDKLFVIIENVDPTESSTNDSEADLDWDAENEGVETEIAYQNRSDNAKERVKFIIWTDEMDRCLTEILVDQLKQGNKLEKNFKPAAYAAAITTLNENFALNITKENIKSRLKTWKKLYGLVKELLSHRGFEWNEEQKMVVATDSVWNDYIKMHPDAKSLRARSIENYNEFCAIIDNNHANGCWFTNGAKDDLNPFSNSEEHVETPLQNMLVDGERSVDNTGDGTQGSFQRTRARPSSSSHSEEPSKKRRYNDVMVEMMSALAANIGRIADALTGSHQSVCLDELFEMVQNIPGFDDDLIIEACEFLSFDDKRAMMFIKLDERLRKLWLLKRLRGHSS